MAVETVVVDFSRPTFPLFSITLCLCGCCGGAVDSIISVLTQLDGSGFN